MTRDIFMIKLMELKRENVPEAPSGIANDRATASDFQGLI